jgi:predicted kinase
MVGMSVAIIAIGIPGAGKTTVLKPLAERYGLTYINRDDIREEILGDARDQSQNKAVWEESNRRTAASLAHGTGVVLDNTFVESWKRKDMISFLHEAGASPIIGVFADVPLTIAKERNKGRDRVVPDDVLEWMHATLQKEPPSLAEGFDALIGLDEIEKLAASL